MVYFRTKIYKTQRDGIFDSGSDSDIGGGGD